VAVSIKISLSVNGEAVSRDVEPNRLLVEFLREDMGLTGTHVGCDTSQCGACTIHLNGLPVKACSMLAVQAEGAEVTTIEGLAANGGGGELHPMQEAFRQNHGLQCGFCTPGMVMAGIGIAERHGAASDAVIRTELEGNFCRCTGYHNIVKSIAAGAKAMAKSGGGLTP
jgi:carbon-monoxide dehydrogenase small subunit